MLEQPILPLMTAQRRAERRERIAAAGRTVSARITAAWFALRRAGAALLSRIAAALAWIFSAAVFAGLLLIAATGCIVAAVYLLHGLPWALLSAGCMLFSLAALLLRGIANG